MAGCFLNDKDVLYAEMAKHEFNASAVARAHGLHRTTVSSLAQKFGIKAPQQVLDHTPIVVNGGRGIVCGDIHIPVTDWLLLEQMIQSAIDHDATDFIIIAGDMLNQDSLSRFDNKQEDAGLREERRLAKKCIERLLEVFDRIIITKGNHDKRLADKLGHALSFKESMLMFLGDPKVELTALDYAEWRDAGELWRFCHTSQYSRTQLAIPSRLADVHRRNIIGFHRHHHSQGYSPSGYKIGEGGGLFNRDATTYLKEWTTDHPKWQPGWWIMTDGNAHAPLLSPTPKPRSK